MNNGPFFLRIILLIACSSLQGQVLLDTLDTDYRKQLVGYYEQNRSAQNFAKNITHKRVRKGFLKIADYKKADFKEEIKSGKFIYHPQYTPFFDSIFRHIRQKNSELVNNNCQIALTTGPYAEAFSMENDFIGIDLSLLLHFENPYQVAFTIAHEMAHQFLQHGYNSIVQFLEDRNSDALDKEIENIRKQEFNKMKSFELVIRRVAYTDAGKRRKLEQQADSLGFLFFRNAYPAYLQESVETLRILKLMAEANDTLAVADFSQIFKTPTLPFNPEWLVDENTKGYVYKKSVSVFSEDSLKTHYDAESRMEYLKKQFNINAKPMGKSKAYCELIQKGDEELIFELYYQKLYGQSLYQVLSLWNDKPQSPFLKKMLYDNLLELQKARNTYTLNKYLPNPSPDHTKSYNQYLCLIRSLTKNELEQIVSFYQY